jgi:hypothetical protein
MRLQHKQPLLQQLSRAWQRYQQQLQGCGFPGGDGCQLLQAPDGGGGLGAVGLMAYLHDVYFVNGNRSKPRYESPLT